MNQQTRRRFLRNSALNAAGAALAWETRSVLAQNLGERPPSSQDIVVLNPQNRVPVSLIIDDSTCLVNLAHFGIPQFNEVFPDRYRQPWRELPREIPDSFVRKFGEWCAEHGVKGKYSQVPCPACVGWLDRDLPGWSKRELEESLNLVRTLMAPNWDIHPEMITHTWVIDVKTGRPFPERSENYMENWGWSVGKSADELTEYLSYALRILKNAGFSCEGITTPGGFGSRSRPALAQATLQSCRDVFNAEIPHYFRDLFTDEQSVAPLVQYAAGIDGPHPECVVSIIGCTGDWFGGWDGLVPGSADLLITEDGQGGRLPQVIARGEPAIMVCHWPGIYFNGDEIGFRILQKAVLRLHSAHDNIIWMKLSEIARYWAAKELTRIQKTNGRIDFLAPFACPHYTIRIPGILTAPPRMEQEANPLKEIQRPLQLDSGRWMVDGNNTILCFDLPKGKSSLII
ncbi:MAG: hypothetical protein AB1656_23850 [Candidatus Omnitrophota bacterium]